MHFSGVKRVLILSATIAASACTYLVPPDTNPPRYNKIQGERHVPELNRSVGPQSMQQPAAPGFTAMPVTGPAAPMVQQTPPTQGGMAALPPTSPQTQQIAQARMAAQPHEEKSWYDSLAFWRDDEPEAVPPTARRTPSGEYPTLTQVPANPQSDEQRMAAVRDQLEQERAAAMGASADLNTQAHAEPSLMNSVQATAPGPEPVAIAPLPPPPAPMAAMPAPMPMAAAPAPQPYTPLSTPSAVTYYAPAANAEPIVLRPPASAPAAAMATTPVPAYTAPTYAAPSYAYAPAPQVPAGSGMAPALSGGFNPMAEPAPITLQRPATYANGTSYLPDSRYMQRRY